MKTQYKGGATVWLIIIVGTLVGLLVLIKLNKGQVLSQKTNREVALTCTTDMATQFHIHPRLEIIINGKKQEIPTNIGIGSVCMNALHTHGNDGTIHVESPKKRDFTLDDFFAVWKKTYNKDQVLDYKVDATHIIRQTVNGQEAQDYENTIMRDGAKIVISYEEIK